LDTSEDILYFIGLNKHQKLTRLETKEILDAVFCTRDVFDTVNRLQL